MSIKSFKNFENLNIQAGTICHRQELFLWEFLRTMLVFCMHSLNLQLITGMQRLSKPEKLSGLHGLSVNLPSLTLLFC